MILLSNSGRMNSDI